MTEKHVLAIEKGVEGKLQGIMDTDASVFGIIAVNRAWYQTLLERSAADTTLEIRETRQRVLGG